MSEKQQIEVAVRKARQRRYLIAIWNNLWKAGLWGAIVWILGIALFKLFPLPVEFPQWALWAGIGVCALRLLPALFLRPSMLDTARWVDERQSLKERLSTALEFEGKSGSDPQWTELMLRDAARHAKSVNPAQLLPWKFPRLARWTLLAVAIGLGLGFVPEYRSKAFKQEELTKPHMEEVGKEIVRVVKQETQKRPFIEPEAEALMREAEMFGKALQSGTLTRAKALEQISSLADRLRKETENLSRDPSLERMRNAARDPLQSEASAGENMNRMNQMASKVGQNPDEAGKKLAQMQQKLSELKKQAEGLNDSSAAAAQAQMAQMASDMAALQQMANEMSLDMEGLDAAMEALQNSDIDQFLEDIGYATQDIEKLAEMAKALKKMQMEFGADLGEQLRMGQPSIAKANIESMKKRVDQGFLSPSEQLKMLSELQNALDPAGLYTERLQSELSKAAEALDNKNNSAASKALAAAADELEQLIQQAQDCQSLASAFNTMKMGQLSLSQCKGLGQCQNPGLSPFGGPGLGRGMGRIPRLGEWSYQAFDGALPSVRDMELGGYTPEDMTDREVALPENMQRERVKGQFSQGGQMPSMSMKDVYIRGSSDVSFQAGAGVATQGEETSSQNQGRIPKAYQGVVRDYFGEE